MAAQDLLRNKVDETPTIYAYTLPDVPKYKGLLKVGYTSRLGTIRIKEQGHELYLDKEMVLRKSSMRPEQERAVKNTFDYLTAFKKDPSNRGLIPHFLWNAKMRFGKTFTTYQLALKMGWTKVLVLTFKPAVKTAWEEDLNTHKDFEGWQFCQKQEDREFNYVNERKPFFHS